MHFTIIEPACMYLALPLFFFFFALVIPTFELYFLLNQNPLSSYGAIHSLKGSVMARQGELLHLLGSYVTCALHTPRISKVESAVQ